MTNSKRPPFRHVSLSLSCVLPSSPCLSRPYPSVDHPPSPRHRIDVFPQTDKTRSSSRLSSTTSRARTTQVIDRHPKHAPPRSARSPLGLMARVALSPSESLIRFSAGAHRCVVRVLASYRIIQDFPFVFLSPFALDHLFSPQCLVYFSPEC